MRHEFTAISEAAEEGGYLAYYPEVPGANVQGAYLKTAGGDNVYPIAYVLYNTSSRDLEVRVDASTPIRSGRELPLDKMGKNHELYLYFHVRPNTRFEAYYLGGDRTEAEFTATR